MFRSINFFVLQMQLWHSVICREFDFAIRNKAFLFYGTVFRNGITFVPAFVNDPVIGVSQSPIFKIIPCFLQEKGKVGRPSTSFPSAARRMETLNDLLAASDLISLHCALTNDTIQIINAECLQHVKPGIYISIFKRFVLTYIIYYGVDFLLLLYDMMFSQELFL